MELNKTSIKGLYLTTEGKAWHKSAKREIPASTNGKVRFNGKLYDLQKIMIETKPKAPKRPVKKSVFVRELHKLGYRKTKITGLFITNAGLCYNSVSKRSLAIRKGKTAINGKNYNVAKIVLDTFCKIPIRNGQISFKNGNDKDFYFENLDYKSTIKQLPPNETDLLQCIRFYFEIDKKLTTSNILFKCYLNEIAVKRNFIFLYKDNDFILFLEWLKPFGTNQSKAEISKTHNYSTINGTNAINKYLTMLVNECMQDFENGKLKVKEFKPKPPTKNQKLKDLQKSVNEMGLSVKIPLRKSSTKELLDKFKTHLK
ncbi:hypothetical protein [Flavobacterium aquicola]|uniref:Uncharacterized protein n=1 Tax=Flavobacterium aquicola TaxID=1682742 RepID=A0A3E0E429_9FLAO|nr:hypothetical protein [Flavobacterium aquicola]REG93008.1 hypothetical protein C8P67_114109 [Flavobacterium aquicola]